MTLCDLLTLLMMLRSYREYHRTGRPLNLLFYGRPRFSHYRFKNQSVYTGHPLRGCQPVKRLEQAIFRGVSSLQFRELRTIYIVRIVTKFRTRFSRQRCLERQHSGTLVAMRAIIEESGRRVAVVEVQRAASGDEIYANYTASLYSKSELEEGRIPTVAIRGFPRSKGPLVLLCKALKELGFDPCGPHRELSSDDARELKDIP